MELQRIYQTEFLEEWGRAYNDWYGKFSLHAIAPVRRDSSEFWCHIWNGPHCVYDSKELIPGVTIVSGTNSSPVFFTPKEVIEKFEFSRKNPFTRKCELSGTTYSKRLETIMAQIRKNAEA